VVEEGEQELKRAGDILPGMVQGFTGMFSLNVTMLVSQISKLRL
jgi:hypothetical protein